MSDTARRLAELDLVLPAPWPAFGQYVSAVLDGSTLHVGGHFGTRPDGSPFTGTVGRDVLGEAGHHTRLAVGVVSLPADLVLEITAVLRVDA